MPEKDTEKVKIPKEEYDRLKTLEKGFKDLSDYINHVEGVREARRQIEQGEGVEQEEFFEELGI